MKSLLLTVMFVLCSSAQANMAVIVEDTTYHVHQYKVQVGLFQGKPVYHVNQIICKEKH